MNKKYLVTGGCGFIGSHVVDELLKNPNNMVVNIDKMGVGSDTKNIRSEAINYFEDINSSYTETVFQTYKPDFIIHCAAESHVDRSISNPMLFVDSNVRGTGVMLENMLKHAPNARMLHMSTDEVYGHLELEDPAFTENSNLNPRSPYSASKAGSDMLAFSYRETFGLNITVTRCCNNYGERQHSEKFIPTICRSLKNGKKIPVYGNGQNIREWIYVKDHVNSVLEILHERPERKLYNIYGTSLLNNLQLIEQIVDQYQLITGKSVTDYIEFVEDRKGHDFKYAMSSIYDEIKALKNQVSFNEGIHKTVEYYLSEI